MQRKSVRRGDGEFSGFDSGGMRLIQKVDSDPQSFDPQSLVMHLLLAAAVPSFIRIDRHDKSISSKTLEYRPGDPVLLFSL